MKTQGRKNVHGKGGVRFKAAYTASKDKSMLRNVVTQLIVSGHVQSYIVERITIAIWKSRNIWKWIYHLDF